MNLDMDVNMLLSVVNTKLRNHYDNVDDLCKSENTDKIKPVYKLKKTNYTYSEAHNQFIPTDN